MPALAIVTRLRDWPWFSALRIGNAGSPGVGFRRRFHAFAMRKCRGELDVRRGYQRDIAPRSDAGPKTE
jgi:hypothetical protein